MRVGQARKRDANEAEIVKALEAAGAQVTRISGEGAPDLLVRFRKHLWAFEVKSQKGAQTKAQVGTDWPIVRSSDEALRIVLGPSQIKYQIIRCSCGAYWEEKYTQSSVIDEHRRRPTCHVYEVRHAPQEIART